MNPIDVERVALWWGPGILVLVIFGYGFMRLAHYWIEKTMEVKRQQTDSAYGVVRQYIEQYLSSQSSQADALSRLANSVEHRESIESFEHQEILIALKAMHRDFNGLHCRYSLSPCALREPGPPAGPAPGVEARQLAAAPGGEARQAASPPPPQPEACAGAVATAVGARSVHPFAGNTYIKNISLGVK